MTPWDETALWQKTKLYAARAERQEQTGDLFPFWSILALELLGRTVLASVHPALLADPQEGTNLLHAFGFGQPERPRSVPAKTVFVRCQRIVEDFTIGDVNGAMSLINLRNEELHSGGTPFIGLETGVWLSDYYRLCQTLLRFMGQELDDLFGADVAGAAQQMIDAAAEDLESETKQAIADQRRAFRALTAPEKKRLRGRGAVLIARRKADAFQPAAMGRVVSCPACKSDAWLSGEYVRSGEPQAAEDVIVREIVKIPTRLECFVCGLDVIGHGRLHAIGLGGLFTGRMEEDPASFYDIEFDISDVDLSELFHDEYGND